MKGNYKNLFIIGNGFDRWYGLPTSYDEFKKYYRANIKKIAKTTGIQTTVNADGDLITPVELVFSDITKPTALPDEFFWNFENATALLDDQMLINQFDKTNKGLYHLQETVREAREILQKAFGDWIHSILIGAKETGYIFTDDCYFVNFNYTDTLEKCFKLDAACIYHIHGEADDPESIVFGHSTHPEIAFSELMEQKLIKTFDGGKSKRLQGLYLIEDALYTTDKHVQDNLDDFCEILTLSGGHIEDFTDIYVLGHSFGTPDYEYFDFFVKATQVGCDFNKLSALWKVHNLGLENMTEEDLLKFIQMNIVYASQHRKRVLGRENLSFPQAEKLEKALFGENDIFTDGDGVVHKLDNVAQEAEEAVYKRFLMEQAKRTKEVIEELCFFKRVHTIPDDCQSVLKAADYIDGGHDLRSEDAMWHIAYFSNEDKNRIESVMKRAGCKRYELYNGIDECIARFKK